jgi:hypothetical protein
MVLGLISSDVTRILAIAFLVSFYFGIFPKATSAIIILRHMKRFIKNEVSQSPIDEKHPILNLLNNAVTRLSKTTILIHILILSVVFPVLAGIIMLIYKPIYLLCFILFCLSYYLFGLKVNETNIEHIEETYFGSDADRTFKLIFKPSTSAYYIDMIFRWLPLIVGIILFVVLMV